jgi:hypothetical protein
MPTMEGIASYLASQNAAAPAIPLPPIPAHPSAADEERAGLLELKQAQQHDREMGEDLVALAISACDDGKNLSDEGLAAATELLVDRRVPNRAINAGIDRMSAGLSGCSALVYSRLVDQIRRGRYVESGDELIDLINAFAREALARIQASAYRPTSNPGPRPAGPTDSECADYKYGIRACVVH